MQQDMNLIYETKRLLLLKYPRFGEELAHANIEYRTDLKYHTAATDGKNVYFDPDYLKSLSDDDKIFLLAHELMHIKFKHAFRSIDKNGQKRDPNIWNETTDAIINANLQRDGFNIKKGYINEPNAKYYSAEELYQKKLKEKKDNQNDNNSDSNKENDGEDKIQDDHSLWEEAFEKAKESKERSDNSDISPKKEKRQIDPNDIDERFEFEENRKERSKKAKEYLQKQKEALLRHTRNITNSEKINLGSVGESNSSIDWKSLLRREIERTETIWSQRRSIAENNYAYRLEENEIEDEAETEVMIDVSGSVDLDMVKAFLRMLKPILKESKLRVGCFNEKYWGMTEMKSIKDIDNFTIPQESRGRYAWTEDWDLAVRSFSKNKTNKINKIIFTDGLPQPGTMPKEDLKNEKVIWLVYENKNFNPCCGKVIFLTKEQLKLFEHNQLTQDIKKISR